MNDEDLQHIADYMMPEFPARRSDIGFLFGTRHGVADFCQAAYALWQQGMFGHLLVSGGIKGSAVQPKNSAGSGAAGSLSCPGGGIPASTVANAHSLCGISAIKRYVIQPPRETPTT
jgi:hypothetical protein